MTKHIAMHEKRKQGRIAWLYQELKAETGMREEMGREENETSLCRTPGNGGGEPSEDRKGTPEAVPRADPAETEASGGLA